jgi:nucleotide-binding universal stress UspA family protein
VTYRNIVAGTDLSPTAQVATDRAAMLARKLEANLTLLYAGTNPGYPLGALGRSYGADYLAVPGSPAEVLVDECERLKADLLVVGSVGMTGARRFMLGSVPNKVSHSATIDLLIVKSDFERARVRANEYRKLVIGTDGSETSMRAVDVGSTIAAVLDAKPMIVCAYEGVSEPASSPRAGSDDTPDRRAAGPATDIPGELRAGIGGETQAIDVLERAAERASRAGTQAEVHALEGPAAETIVSFAERNDSDLIVIGNIGMTGAKRFMLGNVPHRVSHRAPVDVLILRTK